MKIGIDARSLQNHSRYRGIGHYLSNLLYHLSLIDHDNEYELVCQRDKPLELNGLSHRFSIRKTRIPSFLLFNKYGFEKQIGLPIELLLGRFDGFFFPTHLEASVMQPGKVIVAVLDLIPMVFPDEYLELDTFRLRLDAQKKIWAIKNADLIITISESSKDDIVRLLGVDADKIKVTYCGVSGQFRPIKDRELINRIRNKYKLPEKFIFYVGGIDPRKNVPYLIKSIATLKRRYGFRGRLVIAGHIQNETQYPQLVKLIEELELKKEVIFTGYVPDEDLPALYNAATTFVFPSLYEGFGLPVLEAMACGIPVITSDRTSLPEVAGDAACYVNPEGNGELADVTNQMLENDDLREQMATKGLQRAKLFSWETTARDTISAFETVVNG